MKNILNIIIAIVLGLFIGGAVNMGIIMVSSSVIPLPEGVDPTSMDSLIEGMHLFGPQHFIMPWLAHALGTLVGAFVAAKIARKHKQVIAIVIGVTFLVGGIMNVYMLPSPLWFTVVDLVFAYIPMSLLGLKLSMKK